MTIIDLLEINYEHESTQSVHNRKLSSLVELQAYVQRRSACFYYVFHQ